MTSLLLLVSLLTPLPEHATARAGPAVMSHEGDVRAVAYAPNGEWVVSAGDDGFVRAWSTRDGRALWKRPSACRAECLAFDRDGHLYINEGDAVVVFDEEGQSLRRLKAERSAVRIGGPVAVGPHGYVAAAHEGLLVHGEQPRDIDIDGITALDYSPKGERLAAGTGDGRVFVLLDRTRRFEWRAGRVRDVAFIDADHLAVIGYDQRLRVFDVGGGPPRRAVDLGHEATGLAVHPATGRAAVGLQNGDIAIVDLGAGEVERRLVGHLPGGVPAVAFSPDGSRVISGGDDNSVRLWSVAEGVAALPHWQSSGWLQAVALTGDSFLTGDVKGRVLRWRVSDGSFLGQVGQIERDGKRAPVNDLVATEEGVVAVDADGGPELLLGRGRAVVEPDGGSETLVVHENFVVSACEQRKGICVRRLDTGETVARADHSQGEIVDVALDAGRRLLVTASSDGRVELWGFPKLAGPRLLTRYGEPVRAVAFGAGGVVASASGDEIRLHDARSARKRSGLVPGCGEILDVAFAPEGRRLAFACGDGRIGLWDTRDASQAMWLDGHDDAVTRIVFTPDGSQLVSTSRDLTALIWRVPGASSPSS